MQKESIMGTTPIPRLIIKTSIPLIISLLVNNLYNLVDSIFVSRVSEDALTGISIAAPLQMLMIALGCGLAVGLKAMGEKQPEEVKKTTSAAIVMAFGAYLINVIVCLLLVKPYFAWQAGGNEVIARYGISYIRICMLFSFGQMLQWVFDRLLIATGKSNLFLATLGTASLVNVILDPILIFGYFGFPAMGTAGAAAATVTGQLAGGLLGIYLNIKRNKEIPVHFTLHIQKKYVANILKVGIPTAIVQGIMSVMGIFINTILYQFSSTAVAIYGILMKVQNLAQIGVQGMNNGLIPIIAYNYGAGKEKRIHETIRYAFLYAVIIMTVVLISLELIPDKILMLFDASDTARYSSGQNYVGQLFCIVGGDYICGNFSGVWKWKLQYVSCIHAPGNSAHTDSSDWSSYRKYNGYLVGVCGGGGAVHSFWNVVIWKSNTKYDCAYGRNLWGKQGRNCIETIKQ